jgi:hypothetical protein
LLLGAPGAARAAITANVNDAFNAWLISGLKSARAKYSPDACLVAAYLRVSPGNTAQEFYAMVFYDPAKRGTSYVFRSPNVLTDSGDLIYTEASPQTMLGPIAETPSCIGAMPVSLLKAYRTAFPTDLPLGKEDSLIAVLADFHEAQASGELMEPSTYDQGVPLYCTLAPLRGLRWAFAIVHRGTADPEPTLRSVIVVDARSGARARVSPLKRCPESGVTERPAHGAGAP